MNVKLTDRYGMTKNDTQWGEGVTHTAKGNGDSLCSDGWIHFYHDPLIAVLMDPIHGKFGTGARMWEIEYEGEELYEDLKAGAKTVTAVREIPMPIITQEQRTEIAIRLARLICSEAKFVAWANNWLDGSDRSKESAYATAAAVYATTTTTATAAAANAAAAYATTAAVYAAVYAATATANAAAVYAANAAANAAAYATTTAAVYAAYAQLSESQIIEICHEVVEGRENKTGFIC